MAKIQLNNERKSILIEKKTRKKKERVKCDSKKQRRKDIKILKCFQERHAENT